MPRHRGSGRQLLPPVYNEQRKLVAHKMAAETPGCTLQPTALVHEAWLEAEPAALGLAGRWLAIG